MKAVSGFLRPKRFRSDESGNSVVEFALIAPALALVLVAVFDVAMAIGEQVSMDRVLRAAAQTAMEDPGVEKVRDAVRFSASRSIGVTAGEPNMSVRVDRWCACSGAAPAGPEAASSCESICPDGRHPYAFYDLSAARSYSGVIVPAVPLASASRVQVR